MEFDPPTMTLPSALMPFRVDETGTVRVGPTRVPLDTIACEIARGSTAPEIVDAYDSLTLPLVYSAMGLYLQHKDLFDEYLARRNVYGDRIRAEVERLQGPPLITREILLARLQSQTVPV